MAHYGTLRDFAFKNNVDVDDIRGSAVYGVDNDKLGKIDDVIFDHRSGDLRYVVIDTGGWLSSKKFLVPADRIHDLEKDRDSFQVDLTKEHIERFPRYDEDKMKSESDWNDYEDRYKQGWDEAPVQHQEGRLDLNVTPADVSGIAPREVRAQRDVNVPMGSMGEEVSDIRDVNTRDQAEEDLAGVPSREGELASGNEFDRQSALNRDISPQSGYDEDVVHQHSRFDESNIHRVDHTDRDRDRQQLDRERLEVHRADTGQWHPRMRRFEDVLRKNRVDVTASCSSCAAAKKDDAA